MQGNNVDSSKMAEGGSGVDEEIKTASSGSEFIFDFFCEPCKDDGKIFEAEGFCVDCGEYFCGSCYSAHQKTRLTRNHELLDKDKMPKDTPLSSDRINREISTMCKIHADKPVEYYCGTHKILGCSNCFVERHRSCSNIESVSEKASGIWDNPDFKSFFETLESLDQMFRDINKKAQVNVARTKNCYSEIIKAVKQLKEEIIVTLEKLEQDIIAEAKTLVSEEEKKMSTISNKCSTVAKEIGTLFAAIQNLQSSRRVCQAYILMKQSHERIRTLQNDVSAAEEGLVPMTCKFEPNKKLQELIGSPNALGKISFEVQITESKQEKADKSMLMKATYVSDINVCTNTDDKLCCITGSAVISSNRLIIVDFSNNKVKLLDSETNQVISEMKFSSWPWDATLISISKAAVTLPRLKKILLLSVADTLTHDREIIVDGWCHGVAYSKNRLVVTYESPAKLEIMDLSGNVIKRIQDDHDGKQLFQVPRYVCVSNDGDTLYVSDTGSDTVISLTFNGVVKSKYSDSELGGSRKVCVDCHGNVYVCGYWSRNIHVLTADLTKIQTIPTKAGILVSYLYTVSHCQETNRLYEGFEGKNQLKVYQLT